MAASFGEQMKAAREAQGITLREVAEQTRISLRYLEALEVDNFQVLPGGVFNRSFIKTYAKYIGFDEGKAIQLYQEAYHETSQSDDALLSHNHPKVYTDDHISGSPIINLLLVGGVLLLLGLGVYGFIRWYSQPAAPVASNPPAATPTPAHLAATTPAPAASASPGASPSASPPPPGTLTVQLRAKDKAVMVATGTDGGNLALFKLNAGESRDYTPQQNVAIQYQSPGEQLLEIYINGQSVNLSQFPGVGKTKQVDINITRDDYQKYLSTSAPPTVAVTPTP